MGYENTQDLGYGFKLDGTPKRKPGRKTDAERARIAKRNERRASKRLK